jgi:parallel beta-helix repeat protein
MKGLIYLIVISLFTFAACDGETVTPITEDQESPGGNSISSSDLPYAEIPEEEYTIDLEYWDIPGDGTDPVKTTDNLQAAIDWAVGEGYGIIRLPAGHFLLGKEETWQYDVGIKLRSNMAFLMDKNAVLEMAPNDKWNYSVILVRQEKHVVISGGTISGDRYDHVYTPSSSSRPDNTAHDEGHGITVQGGSEFVTIENTVIRNATGDGILLVSEVNNIDIRKNNIYDNRRQGISIVGANNVVIEDNEIHHIKGTNPQFGIDIESAQYSSSDIIIRSNHFHHNHGGDIVNVDGMNVLIEDNIMEQGEGSEYRDGPIVFRKNTELIILNNEITMLSRSLNGPLGILMYSDDSPKEHSETTYISNNTLNNCGFYMYKTADLHINDNKIIEGFMTFKEINNLTLSDNNVILHDSGASLKAYGFVDVTGAASGNTHNKSRESRLCFLLVFRVKTLQKPLRDN